jgi:hypothetical protein
MNIDRRLCLRPLLHDLPATAFTSNIVSLANPGYLVRLIFLNAFSPKNWRFLLKLPLVYAQERNHYIGFQEKRHFCRTLPKIA